MKTKKLLHFDPNNTPRRSERQLALQNTIGPSVKAGSFAELGSVTLQHKTLWLSCVCWKRLWTHPGCQRFFFSTITSAQGSKSRTEQKRIQKFPIYLRSERIFLFCGRCTTSIKDARTQSRMRHSIGSTVGTSQAVQGVGVSRHGCAGVGDTTHCTVYSGRPLHCLQYGICPDNDKDSTRSLMFSGVCDHKTKRKVQKGHSQNLAVSGTSRSIPSVLF